MTHTSLPPVYIIWPNVSPLWTISMVQLSCLRFLPIIRPTPPVRCLTILWEFPRTPRQAAVTGQAGIKIFKYWPLLIFYTTRGDNISISTTVVQYQYIKLWLDSFRNMASVFLILGHIKLASSIGQFNCTLMKNYVSYLVLRERKGLWQCHNVSKGALTETLDSKGCSRQVGHFNKLTTFKAY